MRTNRRSYTEVPLRHDQLVRQFVLAEDRMHLPPSWPEVRIGHEAGWVLACHPALPVLAVEGNGGRQIGYLLGWPLDEHQGFVSAQPEAKLCLDVDASQMLERGAGEESPLEKALYRLGGRWVFILAPHSSSASGRIYLDPLGSQPVVYSAPLRMVAATTALIPHTEATGYDAELVALMDLPRQDRWFPFGLTPRRSCSRLLPNHYLDLATMCPVRHWPLEIDKNSEVDIHEAVELVATAVERHISIIAQVSPILCTLTAGKDTRTLLAASRKHLDRILFYTLSGYTQGVQRDVYTAKKLARRYGLAHQVIPHVESSEADKNAWFERVGECVAGAALKNVSMKDRLKPERILLKADFSIAPGAYYKGSKEVHELPSPQDILVRLNLPGNYRLYKAAEEWSASVPATSHRLWDILRWENKIGAWAAPQLYGSVRPGVILWPSNHRIVVTTALALPWQYKCERRFAQDVIEYLWPDILSIPINEDLGGVKVWREVRRVVARVKRKIVRRG